MAAVKPEVHVSQLVDMIESDPENIGLAVGIAFLLSVETEIIVLPYPLPV